MALLVAFCVIFAASALNSFAQSVITVPATNAIQIVELQGSVEVLPANTTTWIKAQANQILRPFDRIHTADNSRIALRWSNQSIVQFGPATQLEILPSGSSDDQPGVHLIQGIISFFHRDKPGSINISTRGAVAGVEGTEFVLAVDEAERTTLSVVDGKVKFGNEQATLLLTNGEQAVVELGHAPMRTAGFIANNLLQWCFYYPAVIDPAELQFTASEEKNLAASLAAYRSGDLLAALAKFPAGKPGSDSEQIYHAALLLSVGEVEKAETTLASLSNNSERTERLADSLRQLIAAVKRQAAVIIVGPFSNFAALLNSSGDENSPLDGIGLVKHKVKFFSVMAGAYHQINHNDHYLEYNVLMDISAAQTFARDCPSPVVWSGYEVGNAIPFPAASIEHDFSYVKHHPVAEAYYMFHPPPYERPTWDLTATLYAVLPDRGYFQLSPPGEVTVEKDGYTLFTPKDDGRDQLLVVESSRIARIREAMAQLSSQPPLALPVQ